MSTRESIESDLPNALKAWLDYQIMCQRDMLLSESYLAHPIGEFLRTHHSGDIESEYNHPQIQQPDRGRPRQIDYALLTRDKGSLKHAIEAKWISNLDVSKQRIMDDILRLEMLTTNDGVPKYRYLIIAGERGNIKNRCIDLTYRNGNGGTTKFVEQLLPLRAGDSKNVKVRKREDNLRNFYASFENDYNVEIPISFKTTLVDDCHDDKARVMLWRITSVPGRGVFSPADKWHTKVPETEDEE